ncbi:YdeI/OmpD-associated family protein, partial [Flavobacterium sp.]
KFSPYKQKEFIEYIESAKREETKLTRIEKIKPMILDNIGLNDKYR